MSHCRAGMSGCRPCFFVKQAAWGFRNTDFLMKSLPQHAKKSKKKIAYHKNVLTLQRF